VLNCIDYGGQPEYYLTHELFLSRAQAIYLLVSNCMIRDDSGEYKVNKKQFIELQYWLSFVCSTIDPRLSFGVTTQHAPLKIVTTFHDCEPSPDSLNFASSYKQLSDHYGKTLGLKGHAAVDYRTSGTSEDDLLSLRDSLLKIAHDQVDNIRIPKSYEILRELVSRLRLSCKPPLLTMTKLCEIVAKTAPQLCSDRDLLLRGLNYLEVIGTVLYSKSASSKSLEGIIVLDPFQWLSRILSYFYAPEDAHPLFHLTDGVIALSEIEKGSVSLQCTPTEIPYVMEFLCRLGICVRLKSQERRAKGILSKDESKSMGNIRYIFPLSLPEWNMKVKSKRWPPISRKQYGLFVPIGRRVKCAHHFDHIPMGLFSKLQVEVYTHYHQVNGCLCLLWRNSLLVLRHSCRVLLEWSIAQNIIHFDARSYFSLQHTVSSHQISSPLPLLNEIFAMLLSVTYQYFPGLKLAHSALCYECMIENRSPCSEFTVDGSELQLKFTDDDKWNPSWKLHPHCSTPYCTANAPCELSVSKLLSGAPLPSPCKTLSSVKAPPPRKGIAHVTQPIVPVVVLVTTDCICTYNLLC